jgi:very-short-patch-repair endonuclease
MTTQTELEATLELYLRANDIPAPEREYKFHPKRKWRFDMCWPAAKLAVEVQGGIHMKRGGHNTAAGITRDCEKGNEAQLLGWRLLHVTSDHIYNGTAIDWIRRALAEQGAEGAPETW